MKNAILNIQDKKQKAAILSVILGISVFALAALWALVYGIIIIAYTGSIKISFAAWGFAPIFAACAAGLFYLLNMLFEKNGLEFKKPFSKTTFKTVLRFLILGGVIILAIALAMGGFGGKVKIDDTQKLRAKYGFLEKPETVVLNYYDVENVYMDFDRTDLKITTATEEIYTGNDENPTIVREVTQVMYTNFYKGQITISKSAEEGKKDLTIKENPPPKYPKILWWAFE